ncbi:MAG: hypothetical protein IPM58_02350 [Nitrospira sp.]|nr:hypothetical protein [Nitrospira sp.]
MKKHPIWSGLVIMSVWCMVSIGALAERYEQELSLVGVLEPTKISGFSGTKYRVGVPDSQGDEYALYGITSEERRDNPCYVTVRTENINDSGKALDLKKDLCGGKQTSSTIAAEYSNSKYDKRVFVTGAAVCMNNDNTRVKGIKIRGKKLGEDGGLIDLQESVVPENKSGMPAYNTSPTSMPTDVRAHCNDNWKKWAQCPDAHIATAAILHYEAGKEPRSLTGLELECRRAALPGTGAVRAE